MKNLKNLFIAIVTLLTTNVFATDIVTISGEKKRVDLLVTAFKAAAEDASKDATFVPDYTSGDKGRFDYVGFKRNSTYLGSVQISNKMLDSVLERCFSKTSDVPRYMIIRKFCEDQSAFLVALLEILQDSGSPSTKCDHCGFLKEIKKQQEIIRMELESIKKLSETNVALNQQVLKNQQIAERNAEDRHQELLAENAALKKEIISQHRKTRTVSIVGDAVNLGFNIWAKADTNRKLKKLRVKQKSTANYNQGGVNSTANYNSAASRGLAQYRSSAAF